MKKLLALLVVAGFLVLTTGCPSPTSKGGGAPGSPSHTPDSHTTPMTHRTPDTHRPADTKPATPPDTKAATPPDTKKPAPPKTEK